MYLMPEPLDVSKLPEAPLAQVASFLGSLLPR
jgi:hypothetical protein